MPIIFLLSLKQVKAVLGTSLYLLKHHSKNHWNLLGNNEFMSGSFTISKYSDKINPIFQRSCV